MDLSEEKNSEPLVEDARLSSFDYLVIIDLEATCDEGIKPLVTRSNQEVIEFPWVVLDVAANKIIEKQQRYVKPVWSKELTEFCTKLTGITNEKIHGKPTLPEVLVEFDQYCHDNFVSKQKTFCIVTDGHWDLKICLVGEAQKKNIPLAKHHKQYFNLQHEFDTRYNTGEYSLKRMLKHLGYKFEGNHHSGIDDCVNICRIAQRLVTDGHIFATPEVIPDDYNPDLDESFKDYNHAVAIPSCVLRLRGLPFKATVAEIKLFFAAQKIKPRGVHFILADNGKPSGVAYVEFVSIDEASKALKRNKDNFIKSSRYVDIFMNSVEEMKNDIMTSQQAVNEFAEKKKIGVEPTSKVLRLDGLPYQASPADIQNFFRGCRICPNGIQILFDQLKRPLGAAIVQFVSLKDAKEALKRDRQYIGKRYIEVSCMKSTHS